MLETDWFEAVREHPAPFVIERNAISYQTIASPLYDTHTVPLP